MSRTVKAIEIVHLTGKQSKSGNTSGQDKTREELVSSMKSIMEMNKDSNPRSCDFGFSLSHYSDSSCQLEHFLDGLIFQRWDISSPATFVCLLQIFLFFPGACDLALGMESGDIPDGSITATSSYVPNVGPQNGR